MSYEAKLQNRAKFLIKTQGKNRTSNMSGIGADLVHGI